MNHNFIANVTIDHQTMYVVTFFQKPATYCTHESNPQIKNDYVTGEHSCSTYRYSTDQL